MLLLLGSTLISLPLLRFVVPFGLLIIILVHLNNNLLLTRHLNALLARLLGLVGVLNVLNELRVLLLLLQMLHLLSLVLVDRHVL